MKKIWIFLILATLAVSMPACNGKKKLAEKEAAEKLAQIEKAKKILRNLLVDNTLSLDEKQRQLDEVKAMNLDDAEVKALIVQVENMLREERRKQEEERLKKEEEAQKKLKMEQFSKSILGYFEAIANAPSVDVANAKINEALTLFKNEQTPVLIVIKQTGEVKDYDRPTTIKKYLEFIKDQKRYERKVSDFQLDAQDKITELELSK